MPPPRTLIDEAAELIDCLSTDEKKQLFARIPGMNMRVFRKRIRFIWHAPVGTTKNKSTPARRRKKQKKDGDTFIRL